MKISFSRLRKIHTQHLLENFAFKQDFPTIFVQASHHPSIYNLPHVASILLLRQRTSAYVHTYRLYVHTVYNTDRSMTSVALPRVSSFEFDKYGSSFSCICFLDLWNHHPWSRLRWHLHTLPRQHSINARSYRYRVVRLLAMAKAKEARGEDRDRESRWYDTREREGLRWQLRWRPFFCNVEKRIPLRFNLSDPRGLISCIWVPSLPCLLPPPLYIEPSYRLLLSSPCLSVSPRQHFRQLATAAVVNWWSWPAFFFLLLLWPLRHRLLPGEYSAFRLIRVCAFLWFDFFDRGAFFDSCWLIAWASFNRGVVLYWFLISVDDWLCCSTTLPCT